MLKDGNVFDIEACVAYAVAPLGSGPVNDEFGFSSQMETPGFHVD